MNSHFEYKGYIGSAEVDVENNVLVGRLLFIRDAIGYSAVDPAGLRKAFEEAVDDYLSSCAETGDQPDTPCKGTFNVRVGPVRHREAALLAMRQGATLNDLVCTALDQALGAMRTQTVVHRHEHTVVVSSERKEMIVRTSATQPGVWESSSGQGKH